MITLHNKDFTLEYGVIDSICEAFVEEERNGLFELSFIMLNTDKLFNLVKEDNIVVANANDTLLNQKFRIYMTRKLMNNRVEVFARHISFDLMYDYIDNISFTNQSCEYALNQLFRSSNFSKHYKGYSDIVHTQNYSMSMSNVLEAIAGKKGSIIDTFGNGAEILRDNENIHVLSKRGHDNSVTIEYRKNLTGFELEEDTTDLVTRILPYARYTPEGGEEVTIKSNYVDSPFIANYSHPFISPVDFTEKMEGYEINEENLRIFANRYFENNNCDRPKQNFKIDFIPLSKCVGYEGLEDKISLCDTVTIIDTRYNINTQAKVIKTVFNVLKNRYESIELGNPKTSLNNIIDNEPLKGEKGDKGDKGDKGEDGNIGDFPNSLPATPTVTTTVNGFSSIDINWTFENKVYYQYEVYASKEFDFIPNTFNLIYQGQSSSYTYQAKVNETWYFKVCAINTYGNRTSFGSSYATTVKANDLSNYFEETAIGKAVVGSLTSDYIKAGTIKGSWIDAKQLSVTDSNGKRTLDIDSYGNIVVDAKEFRIDMNDGEGDQGYTLIANDGFSIFDNKSNKKAWFGQNDTMYIDDLYADNIHCNKVVKMDNDKPYYFYVNSNAPAGSNQSGTSPQNACSSITEMIARIKDTYGQYNSLKDIIIDVASGDYFETVFIHGFLGSGNLIINMNDGVKLYGCFSIFDNTMMTIIRGNKTNSETNNGAEVIVIEEGLNAFLVRNCHCSIESIRAINKSMPNSYENYNSSFVHGECANVYVEGCDISRFYTGLACVKTCQGAFINNIGNVYLNVHSKCGSFVGLAYKTPKAEVDILSDYGGMVNNIDGNIQLPSLYDPNYNTPGADTPIPGTPTVFKQSFALTNLRTIPEGSGSSTSKRSGQIGQGKWGSYKAHRGYADIPQTLFDLCQNATNISMTLTMTRLSNSHGYSGEVPSPKIVYNGGIYDTNVKFSRGATKTITLPIDIVSEIANGTIKSLQLWAGTSEVEYSFYNNVLINVECSKNV